MARPKVARTAPRERLTEAAKLRLRRSLAKANLSIGRDPFSNRLCRALDHAGIDAVLDIGANVGQFASSLRTAGFNGLIVSAEPLDFAYDELRRRSASDPQWEVENVAVGAEPGETTINVAGNSYSSSLLEMNEAHLRADPASATVGTQPVQVTTVVELVETHRINPQTALLKIDTQGFEAEVLRGAGPLLSQFGAVQVELSFVELYAGQPTFDEVVANLDSHGFTLWSFETGISDDAGRLLQCDGLFLRVAG